MLEDASLPRPSINTTNVDPPQPPSPPPPPRRRPPPPKLPRASAPPQTQPPTPPTLMITTSLQRSEQMTTPQPRSHLQQHPLVEPLNRPATPQQPAHDRRRH